VTATAKRKSTAPRKAAKARANGAGNGAPPLPAASNDELRAPERFEHDPTKSSAPEPPPEQVAPEAAVPGEVKIEHPYGDKQVYVFTPQQVQEGDSTDPIVVPHITTLDADVEFFWELDNLDPMHQAFQYMKRAEIPREIQRRVVRLPQAELARFLNNWFLGVLMPQGVGPPGES
jgi:hypothetical protein